MLQLMLSSHPSVYAYADVKLWFAELLQLIFCFHIISRNCLSKNWPLNVLSILLMLEEKPCRRKMWVRDAGVLTCNIITWILHFSCDCFAGTKNTLVLDVFSETAMERSNALAFLEGKLCQHSVSRFNCYNALWYELIMNMIEINSCII